MSDVENENEDAENSSGTRQQSGNSVDDEAAVTATTELAGEVGGEETTAAEAAMEEATEEPTTTTTTTTTVEPRCQSIKYQESSAAVAEKSLIESSYACERAAPLLPSMPQFLSVERSVASGYPISQAVICNNAITILNCPVGQLIHVYSAYYGVQSDTATACVTVSPSAPSLCFSNYTLNRLNSMCEAKQSCSILVTSSNLGEPCLGVCTFTLSHLIIIIHLIGLK